MDTQVWVVTAGVSWTIPWDIAVPWYQGYDGHTGMGCYSRSIIDNTMGHCCTMVHIG